MPYKEERKGNNLLFNRKNTIRGLMTDWSVTQNALKICSSRGFLRIL